MGFRGVGKTTLAKLVFNNERINEYFLSKMWVCVSESFDVRQLVIKIISSVNDSTHTATAAYRQNYRDLDIEELKNRVKDKLKGKNSYSSWMACGMKTMINGLR